MLTITITAKMVNTHLKQINSGGSATAGIRAETYISEITMNLKTAFGIKDVLNKVFIKTTLDSIMLRS